MFSAELGFLASSAGSLVAGVFGGVMGAGALHIALKRRLATPAVPLTGTTHRPVVIDCDIPDPVRDELNAFLDRLGELDLSSWLSIGARILADYDGLAGRATSIAIRDAAIAGQNLEVGAWYVRDDVETAVFLATRKAPKLNSEDRRRFTAAQQAAEDAALAMLARDHLAPADYDTLYAPFVATGRLVA